MVFRLFLFIFIFFNCKINCQTELSSDILPFKNSNIPNYFQINQNIKNNWGVVAGFSFKSKNNKVNSLISENNLLGDIDFGKISNIIVKSTDYSLVLGVRFKVYEKQKYQFFISPLLYYSSFYSIRSDYIDERHTHVNVKLLDSNYVANLPKIAYHEIEDEVFLRKKGIGIDFTLQTLLYKNIFVAIDSHISYSLINTNKIERLWHPIKNPNKIWDIREVTNNVRGFEFTPLAKIRVGYIWK